MDYEKAQDEWVELTGTRVGDTVMVLFKGNAPDTGWPEVWWSEMMDDLVGRSYKVTEITDWGIQLGNSRLQKDFSGEKYNDFYVPFYVLAKKEK